MISFFVLVFCFGAVFTSQILVRSPKYSNLFDVKTVDSYNPVLDEFGSSDSPIK